MGLLNLKFHFKDEYEEKWSGELDLCNEENNKKLRTYKEFKETIMFETYLMVQCPKYRIAISKLRMSAHNLAIETGRHKSQVAGDRMCNYCNVPETEMHHVMQCTKFDNLRNRLLILMFAEKKSISLTLCVMRGNFAKSCK